MLMTSDNVLRNMIVKTTGNGESVDLSGVRVRVRALRGKAEGIARFPFAALSNGKGLTAQGEILRFAQNDR